MLDPVETVLLREREWLARLRWIDRAEVAWAIMLPLALFVWAGLMLLYAAWPTVLLAAASHAVLGAIALALSPRGRRHIWCGLVLLSMLHFAVFAALGYTHLPALCAAYAVLACLALGWCSWRTAGLLQQWRGIAGHTQRDDFRWLITLSPMPVRYRALRVLRRAPQNPPR
jgi:hypothetical protein